MKSRIISLGLVVSLVCLLPQMVEAQIAASNPLEWTALAEGNELINAVSYTHLTLPTNSRV